MGEGRVGLVLGGGSDILGMQALLAMTKDGRARGEVAHQRGQCGAQDLMLESEEARVSAHLFDTLEAARDPITHLVQSSPSFIAILTVRLSKAKGPTGTTQRKQEGADSSKLMPPGAIFLRAW